MRIRCFLFGVLCCAAGLSAQDVITKTDGSKIDAKVEEITETVIRFRKANNPTGPVYSIPVGSVSTILFENGTTERYTNVGNQSGQAVPHQASGLSDDQLLRMYEVDYPETIGLDSSMAKDLYSKAKKYKKIGWIGGGAIVGSMLLTSTILAVYWGGDPEDTATSFLICFTPGVGAGAIWALCWNLKANSLIKQARAADIYSATIFGNEVCRFGDKSVMAGVNLMGNRMTHTRGLGLSLSLNF